MAPGVCDAHGGICEKIGKIEANTEHLCEQQKEVKGLLEKVLARQESNRVVLTEEKAKSKVLYWTIATAAVAAISAAVDFIIRKICGY